MIFITIDFKKAYDRISREKLIKTLVNYKINLNIIDQIVEMYNGDSMVVKLVGERLNVTSGIR